MSEPRLLVFGDIHGAISPLRRLLARVRPQSDDTLLFLGDYIDRGENSRAVLDHLMRLEQEHACIFLKGNHEDMFLRAYESMSVLDGSEAMITEEMLLWISNGGITTLRDFEGGWPSEPYIHWLSRLRLFYETDTHYFVHAGLRPGAPPEATTDADRMWIREPFLGSDYDWGKTVVFGHTVQIGRPLVHPNKIGIDTGAFATKIGRLTCLILPEGQFVFNNGRGLPATS
ncbi:MAG TPA: metallophosphoesterase family protein [Chloroflexota bacterium]|nr:metallophosphoesterase family protein [Chloroflexota bacterium]